MPTSYYYRGVGVIGGGGVFSIPASAFFDHNMDMMPRRSPGKYDRLFGRINAKMEFPKNTGHFFEMQYNHNARRKKWNRNWTDATRRGSKPKPPNPWSRSRANMRRSSSCKTTAGRYLESRPIRWLTGVRRPTRTGRLLLRRRG